MNFTGTIIEESLEDKSVLDEVKIIKIRVVPVEEKHKTPWLKQWTLHSVEIPEKEAESFAEKIKNAIDSKHAVSWYVDFKNDRRHYIIFRNKIFVVDSTGTEKYEEVVHYGHSLGVPEYQLDFRRIKAKN